MRTKRGQLAVDGRPVWVPSLTVRDPLERTVDSVVASRFADRLVAAVEREIEAGAHDLRIAIDRTADRVVVADGREIIAFVSATRWLRYKNRTVGGTGNFLRPGPQWNALRRHAQRGRRRRSPGQAETGRAQPASLPEIEALPVLTDAQSELHYAFPDGVSQQLVTLGTDASRRLRLERSLSFGHVVHVRSTDGPEAVFSPVHLDRGRPEIDVMFRDGGSAMSLRLRVTGRGDPLPVRAPVGRSAKAVARAWTFALVAFADLTTPPDLDHLRSTHPSRPPSRHPGRSGVSSRATAAERRPAAKRLAAPRTFQPIGETSRWISSYVAGHRRVLPPGHQAGPEALAAAAAAGITLRPGETWVTPHVRGTPPDIRLHFAWHAPKALRTA